MATNNTGSISANDLANPIDVPKLTEPQVGTLPSSPIVNNVAKETGNIIAAQTEEAKDLKKQRDAFAALSQQGSLTDVYNQQLQAGGVTDTSFKELKDINLQLADRGTASELTKTKIAGAAGQTLGQAGREITQEDREAAVRDAGLAARAAVLQGSIETAQAAATQAVNIAFQDRQLTNQNLSAQIKDLSGTVDKQTQQLLDQKQAQIDADNLAIKELKDNVATAMVSGASQAEINQLNDATLDDASKLALAQSITARGATEERDLDLAVQRAELAKAGRASTTVIDRGDGMKQLINSQTGEVIATYGEGDLEGVEPFVPGSVEEAKAQEGVNDIASLATHDGFNSAVGPIGLARMGVADVFGAKDAFIGKVENMLSVLTLNTFAEAKAKGMTFGAMSQGEWDILSQSATEISKWREYAGEGDAREVVGYDIDEGSMKTELDQLTQFAKLGFINKGGDPASVGVQQTEDGSYWTQNSDGSFTKIR